MAVRALAPDGLPLVLPSRVVELDDDRLSRRGVRLTLKRDDLIHPDLPGNKWRKLHLNLAAAAGRGYGTIGALGGAHSNLIRAVAAAGSLYGFRTVGVIRGDERPFNDGLAAVVEHGMRLEYVDRATYRAAREPDGARALAEWLQAEYGLLYLLPEGGSNELAVRGCVELGEEIGQQVPDADVVYCPVGTGGTLAGLAAGLGARRAVGVAVLRGAAFLVRDVTNLQERTFGAPTGNWSIDLEHSYGGYARRTSELDRFLADFADRHGLVVDWVYVGKMLAAIYTLVDDGRIAAGSHVVAVVTG